MSPTISSYYTGRQMRDYIYIYRNVDVSDFIKVIQPSILSIYIKEILQVDDQNTEQLLQQT